MSDPFDAALAGGSTRLCRCWRLTRADGVVMGFTDHDVDLTFDGTTFRANAALTASEASGQLGLAPDELDASGALASDAIRDDDLTAGLYDGAELEAWEVDWADPAVRKLRGRYALGEVERGPLAFRVELRSNAARLDVPEGRVHSRLCDCDALGDARCGLDLAPWRSAASVVAGGAGPELTVSGVTLGPGLLAGGSVAWTSGPNAADASEIRAARLLGADIVLSLWSPLPRAATPGDGLTVTAGCDRSWRTCVDRFGNGDNFRGFPHMPGEAAVGAYAVSGGSGQDGGSRFG